MSERRSRLRAADGPVAAIHRRCRVFSGACRGLGGPGRNSRVRQGAEHGSRRAPHVPSPGDRLNAGAQRIAVLPGEAIRASAGRPDRPKWAALSISGLILGRNVDTSTRGLSGVAPRELDPGVYSMVSSRLRGRRPGPRSSRSRGLSEGASGTSMRDGTHYCGAAEGNSWPDPGQPGRRAPAVRARPILRGARLPLAPTRTLIREVARVCSRLEEDAPVGADE
jgi:hypothetical protein